MGVFWSYGINCDKKTIKKLIDNETWFQATLIEYSTLSSIKNNEWNSTLPRMSKRVTTKCNVTSTKIFFNKMKKCFGRLSVQDNCIIFQGINCSALLNIIVANQDKSPRSLDTSLDDSQDHFPYYRNVCYLYSSTSPTSDGIDNESVDRLHTFVWPIEAVRHFGFKDNFFSFDSGRFSSTGEGRFTFRIKKSILFMKLFQAAKDHLCSSKPNSTSPHQVSPDYYNLATSESCPIYRNNLTADLQKFKVHSNPNNYFFNNRGSLTPTTERESSKPKLSPINYCNIDFSESYSNISNLNRSAIHPRLESKSNWRASAGQTLHYLTICENQTKAVEKVLKRIS